MDTVRRLNERAVEYAEAALARYRGLSRGGKAVVVGMLGLNIFFFCSFWIIGPERIAERASCSSLALHDLPPRRARRH